MKKLYKVGDLVEYRRDSKWYEPEVGLVTQVTECYGGKIFLVVQYKNHECGHEVDTLEEVPYLVIIN